MPPPPRRATITPQPAAVFQAVLDSLQLPGSPAARETANQHQLQKVANFRNVATTADKIAPGMLWRTSYLNHATDRDSDTIVKLGIRTYIDLRSDEEARMWAGELAAHFAVGKEPGTPRYVNMPIGTGLMPTSAGTISVEEVEVPTRGV